MKRVSLFLFSLTALSSSVIAETQRGSVGYKDDPISIERFNYAASRIVAECSGKPFSGKIDPAEYYANSLALLEKLNSKDKADAAQCLTASKHDIDPINKTLADELFNSIERHLKCNPSASFPSADTCPFR
jgi:hypothetical protein